MQHDSPFVKRVREARRQLEGASRRAAGERLVDASLTSRTAEELRQRASDGDEDSLIELARREELPSAA